MSKFSHQSIYPSELREAGAVTFTVLGTSFKSKWPNKKTKAPIYSVKVDYEGAEKYLNFDEKSQADQFDKFEGQKVEIVFDGSDVSIKPLGGGSASSGPVASMDDVTGLSIRVANAMFHCEKTITEQEDASQAVLKIEPNSDNFGGKASTLFKIIEKHGGLMAFPDDRFIWEAEQTPEPATE